MLLEYEEVVFSELPIFKTKEDHHYTLEDILNTDQSVDDFKRSGFVEIEKYNRTFYIPVFTRKEV